MSDNSKNEKKKADKRKKSFYLLSEHIEEMEAEALRLDRSVSWIAQKAWVKGREQIRLYESINE